MFTPAGCEHRDIICFFLMHHREGSKRMLYGCAMCGCSAPCAVFLNSLAEFGENRPLYLI